MVLGHSDVEILRTTMGQTSRVLRKFKALPEEEQKLDVLLRQIERAEEDVGPIRGWQVVDPEPIRVNMDEHGTLQAPAFYDVSSVYGGMLGIAGNVAYQPTMISWDTWHFCRLIWQATTERDKRATGVGSVEDGYPLIDILWTVLVRLADEVDEPTRDKILSFQTRSETPLTNEQINDLVAGIRVDMQAGRLPVLGGVQVVATDYGPRDSLDYMNLVDQISVMLWVLFGTGLVEMGKIDTSSRACYSGEDTQTLTEHGWKYWWEVQEGEKIAAYDVDSGWIVWVIPEKLHVYPYEGPMCHFKSPQVDILVTPEHRMLVASWRRNWRVLKAKDVPKELAKFMIKMSASFGEGSERETFVLPEIKYPANWHFKNRGPVEIDMDDWLRFLGWFVAEGSLHDSSGHYGIRISQHPESSFYSQLEDCLGNLPFDWRVENRENNGGQGRRLTVWECSDKSLFTWLRDNVGRGSGNKRLPEMTWDVSARQWRILFDALMAGDASAWDSGRKHGWVYTTASAGLADDVQMLTVKLGLSAGIGVIDYYRADGFHVLQYRVHICTTTERCLSRHQVKQVPYSGTVYCFSVPKYGFFVTRRNGKIAIQGNTAEAQISVARRQAVGNLKEILLDDFFVGTIASDPYSEFLGLLLWWEDTGSFLSKADRMELYEPLMRYGLPVGTVINKDFPELWDLLERLGYDPMELLPPSALSATIAGGAEAPGEASEEVEESVAKLREVLSRVG
jgi:hypothetical protein